MSNHVVDGVLVRSSPSAIVTFDDKTPFGCRRKWFFEHVLGVESEDAEHLIFGTEFHGGVEYALGVDFPWKPREHTKPRLVAMVNAGRHIIDEVKTRLIAVEDWMDLDLDGVKLKGRIDVITTTGPLDWKTSSDVKKYAKTAGQLRVDTQMLTYAEYLRRRDMPWQVLEHVTFQSKGALLVEPVKAKIDAATLDTGLERVISLLAEMKVAAKATDISEIKPTADKQKCNRCPFQPSCPQGNPRMSLMSILSKNTAPAPVVPPDAPKSDPALAAKPVAGFEAVPPPKKNKAPITDVPSTPPAEEDEEAKLERQLAEAKAKKAKLAAEAAEKAKKEAEAAKAAEEAAAKATPPPAEGTTEKRGPGRPPGAKNKPKDLAERIQTVTITRGGTVNMGNYQSARFEVSMSIACDEDVDTATKYLDEKVTALAMAELGRLEEAAKAEAK